MRLQSVRANNHKREFEVELQQRRMTLSFARVSPTPAPADPLVELFIDEELGREAFTYRLASGLEGSVHVEQVLDYNRDPTYLRDQLLYRLTLEADRALQRSGIAKREIARRLDTSPAQLYRLLDTTNYRKSVDQLLMLLQVLNREVEFTVRSRKGSAR